MQGLIAVLVTWLAVNFGLPPAAEEPKLAFASAADIATIRIDRANASRPDGGTAATPDAVGHGVHAIYDDRSRTIYLPEGWEASSPGEVSLLVHELVHHLQNAGGLTYACAEAHEKPAYQAQARWLELFGRTLADEFGLDPMTLLVRTNCMH